MPSAHQSYDTLLVELREIQLISSICSMLGWDEQTQLPPKGAAYRAEQMAYFAAMRHRRFTSPKIGELLATLETSDLVNDSDGDAAVNVRCGHYSRPPAATASGFGAWAAWALIAAACCIALTMFM